MKKYKLWTNDIVFDNDDIWFSATQFNGLFKASMHSGEAKFIRAFPGAPKLETRLHSAVFKYNDELLFLPDLSSNISIYNLSNGRIENIEYPVKNMDKGKDMIYCPKIIGGILIESNVYAFGGRNPCIIRYDFKSKQVKVYDEWFEEFKKYGYKENTSFFCRDFCRIENSIFARTYQNSMIIEFNFKTEKISFHQTGEDIADVLCDAYGTLWILKKNAKNIITWNIRKNLFKKIEIGNNITDINCNYQCSIMLKDEIWLFPYFSEPILVINRNSKNVKFLDIIVTDEGRQYQNSLLGSVWFRKIYKDKLYFMSVLENRLYSFANSEGKEMCIDLYTDEGLFFDYIFHEPILVERAGDILWRLTYGLEDWMEYIYINPEVEKNVKTYKNIGKNIHRILG